MGHPLSSLERWRALKPIEPPGPKSVQTPVLMVGIVSRFLFSFFALGQSGLLYFR
jgi:hypothetical protein